MHPKIYLSLLLFLLSTGLFAQMDKGFHYQAIARNASGAAMANQALEICLAIQTDSTSGAALYEESHTVTTDTFGLFTLVVGQGQASMGNFDTLSWGQANRFLKVSLAQGGGSCQLMGSNQLWGVPYALSVPNEVLARGGKVVGTVPVFGMGEGNAVVHVNDHEKCTINVREKCTT